ncbi:pirin family protein [Vulcanococcus sp.]|jgi:redox-sensitive bicupin YhaK (pirin superfamily)|uniref:pirin family protein n=1 Tax=Vulcanococcus sp. TaxID=2856995 RepID=UPI0037DA75F5
MHATPLHRPAAERFHSQLDWLDSWHSFSFAGHHDPAWMGFGPLRVINDDTIAAGRGFGMHPHRDMEIVTVMLEGELHHRDSMGHAEVLRAGEVQRMSAGTGVVHSEVNGGHQPCRLLQIWIEPSTSGLAPAYEQRPFPPQPGQWTPLLDPERRGGAMAIERPVRLWRGQLAPQQRLAWPQDLAAADGVWLQLIEGELRAPWALRRGDGLGLAWPASELSPELSPEPEPLEAAAAGADLLLFALA